MEERRILSGFSVKGIYKPIDRIKSSIVGAFMAV